MDKSKALCNNIGVLFYLLTVLQHALFGSDAGLASGRVRLPAASLDVDVHVEFAAEHGDLRLGHREPGTRVGCQRL